MLTEKSKEILLIGGVGVLGALTVYALYLRSSGQPQAIFLTAPIPNPRARGIGISSFVSALASIGSTGPIAMPDATPSTPPPSGDGWNLSPASQSQALALGGGNALATWIATNGAAPGGGNEGGGNPNAGQPGSAADPGTQAASLGSRAVGLMGRALGVFGPAVAIAQAVGFAAQEGWLGPNLAGNINANANINPAAYTDFAHESPGWLGSTTVGSQAISASAQTQATSDSAPSSAPDNAGSFGSLGFGTTGATGDTAGDTGNTGGGANIGTGDGGSGAP